MERSVAYCIDLLNPAGFLVQQSASTVYVAGPDSGLDISGVDKWAVALLDYSSKDVGCFGLFSLAKLVEPSEEVVGVIASAYFEGDRVRTEFE
jgi:hypothetical protein